MNPRGSAFNANKMSDPKWYDSAWLSAYYAAKDVIARVAPARLDEFVHSFDVLRTTPSFEPRHLPGVFDATLIEQIRNTIGMIPKDKYELHEMKSFGRFVVHDWPEFTRLQHSLVDRVSDWAGEQVEPCYNFLSLYTKLGVCEPHLDAPAAKWTLDVCIDQSETWPIHFSQIVPWPEKRPNLPADWRQAIKTSNDFKFSSVELTPGDAVLFSGSSQWHYRDALPGGVGKHFCDLLFFHYIPAGAGDLVRGENWARIFGIPEIGEIPGIEQAY